MKRTLSLFLTLVMVLGILTSVPVTASATSVGEGMCGSKASWVLDNKGTLTISGSGAIAENPWADYSLLIKNIVIEEGITRIDVSFRDYGAIKNVSLPQGLVSIGSFAFFGCVSLGSIKIPDTVTSIGVSAFYGCNGLTEVTIPASVTNLDSSTFSNCKSLKKAFFEEGTLNKVPSWTFEGCTSLQEVILPESVTDIETGAFEDCSSLSSINIPSKLSYIGNMAFYDCYSLKSVYITDLNAWCNIDFVHAHSDGGNPLTYGIDVTLYLNGKPVTDLNIPDSITEINDYAFYSYDSLKSVTISGNTKVGKAAFLYCKNLEEVTFKDGIMVINERTFADCSNLKYVRLPDSLVTIATDAFSGTKNLISVEYSGTEEEWDEITILEGNETLKFAYAHKQHNYSDWITDKKATVNAAGSKHKECTECGEVLETAEIPQLKCSKPKLKTIANTEYGVKITWGKVNGADRYRVYRKTSKSDWKYIGYTSKTYYTDKTAKSGTKYYYAIKARNEAGNSLLSSSLSKYYLADPTLKTPSSSKTGVKLTWNKIGGAEGYMVYRKTGTGSYSRIATVKGSTKVTYTDKSAKKGKKYTYKIKAYKSKTYSAYSNTKTITDKY